MTLVLGIESSCDETACAIVRDGHAVLANVIASQHELHEEYAGVVPEIASRAHVERIVPVLRRATADAGVTLGDIDAVSVGHRPGLIGALLVGVAAAKALAWSLGKPLIGIDHIHAHLYAGLLDRPGEPADRPPDHAELFPALGLVVSGGHTALYRTTSPIDIKRLGATIDDAVGEAYDKVATMLDLPYPGGPNLDRLALEGDDHAHDFPISRLDRDSLDFSFSGLKTAVLYTIRGLPQRDSAGGSSFTRGPSDLTPKQKADIAASFQRAAIRALILKIERALDQSSDFRSLLIGGGVSANMRLRHDLADLCRTRDLPLMLPPMDYCMDNAAMIAGLAYHMLRAGLVDDLTLRAEPTSRIEQR
ncbi:MAG: tRNA (adenosine(37)-N6)-threonylcarbamoyltransferase complex transferase subunit TsaD [Phycisphaeraceae bacterium]|nr:MAG: tRNA (adenosine(37)-N6)-threonylcarbamoyltransferase complex transferase subunit TsaD [Phycisphaeraceae bacterium]